MTREEIIAANPIEVVLAKRGINLKKSGADLVACCPIHKENTPSFHITPAKNLFYCFGCGFNGSVIDLVAKLDGITIKQAMALLAGESEPTPLRTEQPKVILPGKEEKKPEGKEIEAVYPYRDEHENLLYEVVRFKPKDFRQRRPVAQGWEWNMDGVSRVLYHLPQILRANQVWIVEGEKDVESLTKLGFTATCSVGGAGKWLSAYVDCLKGKEIVLCGDNDEPGRKHMAQVLESLAGKVKSARVVTIPEPYKDVSDFIASTDSEDDMAAELRRMAEEAPALKGGINLPVYSMEELEGEYREFVATTHTHSLNLGAWLPALGKEVRGLVPGELVTILADTGVGKTAILQNIALKAAPLCTLLFELELPGTLTFERFVQMAMEESGSNVQNVYARKSQLDWRKKGLNHVHVCSLSKLTLEGIEKIITKSELKIGERPVLVMIDYIGLVTGKGKDRYERISNVAEEMKILAKSTNTIVVLASQIHRKENNPSGEVSLHDAKDSGSIENSSGLVIGAWREPNDKTVLNLKILKNTKGSAGMKIPCKFNGQTMLITEDGYSWARGI
jgi:5S rRNA maturation endonuclease (ribonuclease M5)